MEYKKALQDLRKQMFEEVPEQPIIKSSFISRPLDFGGPALKPVERTRSQEWLQIIKESSQRLKDKESAPKSGGVAAGIAKGIAGVIEEKKVAKTAEKNKKIVDIPVDGRGLISRREDALNSGPADESIEDFVALTDKVEGGGDYDTLFGFSNKNRYSGVKVSQMTIGQIKDFAKPSGDYGQWVKSQVGRVATPMGRYQFVGTTLGAVAKKMGLSDDTVFDRKTQDAMFKTYLKEKLDSADTMSGKIAAVRAGWEGYKSVNSATLAKLITDFEANS